MGDTSLTYHHHHFWGQFLPRRRLHWSLNPSIPYPRRKVFPSACCSGDFSTNQPQFMSWILPYRYIQICFLLFFFPVFALAIFVVLHFVARSETDVIFSQKGSVACPFGHTTWLFFFPFPKKPYEMRDSINGFASYVCLAQDVARSEPFS